jgi:hypothetical protein
MKIEALLAARQDLMRAAIEAELRDVLGRIDRLRVREKALEARVAQLEQEGNTPD